LELHSRELAEHLPAFDAVFVTALKLHDVCVGLRLEILFLVESFLGILVEGLEVCDLRFIFEEVWEAFVELGNEHAELSAPVAHVVYTVHFVAQELKDTADTIALDRGAQVAYVHVFGDVRGREVDQNALFDRACVRLCDCIFTLLFSLFLF
jgi:hypothetical protein